MGAFKIVIEGVEECGCGKGSAEGQECDNENCAACRTRDLVRDFKKNGSITNAKFTHWPGIESEVVDYLEIPETAVAEGEEMPVADPGSEPAEEEEPEKNSILGRLLSSKKKKK